MSECPPLRWRWHRPRGALGRDRPTRAVTPGGSDRYLVRVASLAHRAATDLVGTASRRVLAEIITHVSDNGLEAPTGRRVELLREEIKSRPPGRCAALRPGAERAVCPAGARGYAPCAPLRASRAVGTRTEGRAGARWGALRPRHSVTIRMCGQASTTKCPTREIPGPGYFAVDPSPPMRRGAAMPSSEGGSRGPRTTRRHRTP